MHAFNDLCLLVSCLPSMLEQRTANLTLSGVFDILKFIPFSLCSVKYVPLSTLSSQTMGALAGQLFTDAQTNDSKPTQNQCEFHTSFHYV